MFPSVAFENGKRLGERFRRLIVSFPRSDVDVFPTLRKDLIPAFCRLLIVASFLVVAKEVRRIEGVVVMASGARSFDDDELGQETGGDFFKTLLKRLDKRRVIHVYGFTPAAV